MEANTYWFNRYFTDTYLNYMDTVYNNGISALDNNAPMFMLSPDDAETLEARIRSDYYDYSVTNSLLTRAANNCPESHVMLPTHLTLTEQGMLRLVWSSTNNETLYPCVDYASGLDRKAPIQSFAIWISDLRASRSSKQRFVSPFRRTNASPRHYITMWLVGTVGAKGSGADLELEDIASWRLGRPLYLKDNVLDIPFKMLSGLPETPPETTPVVPRLTMQGEHDNIALNGTNGLTASSYSSSLIAQGADATQAFDGWCGSTRLYEGIGAARGSAGWAVPFKKVFSVAQKAGEYALPPLPDTGNFTVDIQLSDSSLTSSYLPATLGPCAGMLGLGLYGNGNTAGTLFTDAGGQQHKGSRDAQAGERLRYVFTEGRYVKVYLTADLVLEAEVGEGLSVSLADFESVRKTTAYSRYNARLTDYLHIYNDDVTEAPAEINEWLQVQFEQPVKQISGFGVFVDDATPLDQLVKDVTLQVSLDGKTFTDHESFTLAQAYQQVVPLSTLVDAQYIRLRVDTHYGSIEQALINELEVYRHYDVSDYVEKTGVHKNIALSGTNGLTAACFTASSSRYSSVPAAAAFDGYARGTRINPSGQQYEQGYWLADTPENQWIQVDFVTPVADIMGFSIRTLESRWDTCPKDIIVQLSDDGETFIDHETVTLAAEGRFRRVKLKQPATTRYFRLFIINNYGSVHDTEIESLEIYQD